MLALTTVGILAMTGFRPVLAQEAGTLVDDATYETVGGIEITWQDAWSTLGDFHGHDEDTGGDYVFLELDNAESGRMSILEYPEKEKDLDEIAANALAMMSEPPYGDLLMFDERDTGDDDDEAITMLYTANDGSGPPEIAYLVALFDYDGRIYHAHASSRIETFERLITAIDEEIAFEGDSLLEDVDIDEVISTLAANEPIARPDLAGDDDTP
jgi:hypothetical protein